MAALKDSLPFTADKIKDLPEPVLLWSELLVNRFDRLQDLLGNKIINIFLASQAEYEEKLTMLDKVHKLERFGIIESAALWQEMREARNNATHDYPKNPELTAAHLNKIIQLAPKLIAILEALKVIPGLF